jgi:hypothetical protein
MKLWRKIVNGLSISTMGVGGGWVGGFCKWQFALWTTCFIISVKRMICSFCNKIYNFTKIISPKSTPFSLIKKMTRKISHFYIDWLGTKTAEEKDPGNQYYIYYLLFRHKMIALTSICLQCLPLVPWRPVTLVTLTERFWSMANWNKWILLHRLHMASF